MSKIDKVKRLKRLDFMGKVDQLTLNFNVDVYQALFPTHASKVAVVEQTMLSMLDGSYFYDDNFNTIFNYVREYAYSTADTMDYEVYRLKDYITALSEKKKNQLTISLVMQLMTCRSLYDYIILDDSGCLYVVNSVQAWTEWAPIGDTADWMVYHGLDVPFLSAHEDEIFIAHPRQFERYGYYED